VGVHKHHDPHHRTSFYSPVTERRRSQKLRHMRGQCNRGASEAVSDGVLTNWIRPGHLAPVRIWNKRCTN
jgi:hypothetical protein